MNRKLPLLALLLVGTFAYAATEGQVYKWTDAGGVTHYSDAPPPKDALNVQMVKVTGGSHSVSAGSNTETAEKPPASDATAAAPPTATQSTAMADNAANRVKACAQARANLELLQSKFAVSVAGTNGQATPLDDKARQAQIADTSAQIALYCK